MSERSVTYVAPDGKVVRQFARDVCEQLAQQRGDARYTDPEVVNGLADCLDYLAQLLVKYVNRGHYELLDKHNA